MKSNIWIPPWAKGMNPTSKGKSETEAHQDDFTIDSTNSKHLAQTSFWSPALDFQLALVSGDNRVERGYEIEKSMLVTWHKICRIFFLNV